jgi:hypothetical protein
VLVLLLTDRFILPLGIFDDCASAREILRTETITDYCPLVSQAGLHGPWKLTFLFVMRLLADAQSCKLLVNWVFGTFADRSIGLHMACETRQLELFYGV